MKGLNLAEWAIRHKQIVYFSLLPSLRADCGPISIWGAAKTLILQSDRPWLRLHGRALRRSRSRSR